MPASAPSGAKQTASAAAGSASMAKVMGQEAVTWAGVCATRAPRAESSAHLSRDRFQTVTWKPALSRFFAMALPMMPSPKKPKCCMLCPPCWLLDYPTDRSDPADPSDDFSTKPHPLPLEQILVIGQLRQVERFLPSHPSEMPRW